MTLEAVILDLEGVLITTDDCHYRAWKQMTEEQGIFFDRKISERLHGASRMDSLEIILEHSHRVYSPAEKLALATRKNDLYIDLILQLNENAILPGAIETLSALQNAGIKIAVGSSSKNAPLLLRQLKLRGFFNTVVDGNDIAHPKPDPEIFLLVASRLGLSPEKCLVAEDADAGIEAAVSAGMTALGVGNASSHPLAAYHAATLADINLVTIIQQHN